MSLLKDSNSSWCFEKRPDFRGVHIDSIHALQTRQFQFNHFRIFVAVLTTRPFRVKYKN